MRLLYERMNAARKRLAKDTEKSTFLNHNAMSIVVNLITSKRVSLYHYDGEDTSYYYISPAELFCIHDPKKDETILLKYDDLEKIVPSSWERIDDSNLPFVL